MEDLVKKVTVQIVLYEENFELIKKCLINLKGLKVIIVDNKNDLSLKEKVLNEFSIEKYILNKKNIGYSKAHNQAAKLVNTKYLLILNADCLIDKISIQILINTIEENKNCGLVSPTTYDEEGNLTFNSGYFPEQGIKDDPVLIDGDICVNTVLGSSMLISKKLFQELNGFDENFFLYFSDDEICKRINKKKISVIQSFNSKATHIHGVSKVGSIIKRIFLREFHYTFDEMYYYYKQKIENGLIRSKKKKIFNYLIKFFLSIIIFKIKKSTFYLARVLAIFKFYRLNK
tara:strand:+ start:385 stop:1248 length:864 start_codon:yes stop_codon:yes gene_type:complete